MSELNTRIQNKHDTEANWTTAGNASSPFIPFKGEIIIYDPDSNYSYPRVKVGDGSTSINNLNFISDACVSKSGDTMTGTLTVPTINEANTSTTVAINVGTNANSYFQTKKLRGQGDASTYNHAIDFGYSGHDRIDFYEYGGTFNFWANRGSTKLEGDANRVASLQSGKLVERGNTLTYPGKSGTIALTDDIATAVEEAKSEIADNYVTLATKQTISGQKYTTQRLVYRDSSQASSLPSGYQPATVVLAGIGVDTGIQVSSLTLPIIETTFKFGTYGDYDWFGTTDVSSPTILFNVNSSLGTCYVRWGRTGSCNGQTIYSSVANSTAFNTYKIESLTTSQHDFYVNGTLVTTETNTASFTHTGNLLIGRGRTTPTATWKTFKLWDSGILLFEGIGAYNESTKQYGFYDIVSGTFKTTSGAYGTIIGDENYVIQSEVPTNVSQLTNDAGYTTNKGTVTLVGIKMNGEIKGTVTESGIVDLGNVVTVAPIVNDGKLTIQAEGTPLGTFTANQSTDTTVNITASSLGLSGSMKFIGTTTTQIAEGSTTNPITIKSVSVTAAEGNVTIYNHKEFLWTNDAWEELGDESSYAYKSVTITGTKGLEGGGDLTTNREIKHAVPTGATTTTSGFYKVATDQFGHVTGTTVVTKADITGLGIPGSDTNTAHSHTAGTGLSITGSGGISGTTTYSLKTASSSEIGGIKIGYTTSGNNHKVQLDSSNNAYVNISIDDGILE